MEHFEDAAKQRRWNDMKAAVGAYVSQNRSSEKRMSLDDILLNTKAVSFDSLVCQTQIKTVEDRDRYINRGYDILLTEGECKDKLDLDPACIWYSPSISNRCFYFNEDTLAAAPLHLELLLSNFYPTPESFYKAIHSREEEVAVGDYLGSISCLPDAMQIEYFNLLIDKKGSDIPGLYELFFTSYVHSDYGFSGFSQETLSAILKSKTADDKAKTNEALKDLPDVFTIYRGGNTASVPYDKAYSWTLDKNIANFFACRRGSGEGYIVEAQVSKEDVIDAFLDDRCEAEIFVDPRNVKIINETQIHGANYIGAILSEVAPMFHEYKEHLKDLPFAQDSAEHGIDHEARVLLLSLMIAEEMDLPLRDRRVLATAAIYHDTQRVNDGDDLEHGKAAAEFYHQIVKDPDPLVEFLCEYHSRPDEEGYQQIQNNRKLSKSRSRSKLLLDVFKDADGLERVRFGIKALDINQLRLPISQEMTLVARLCKEQIKSLGPQKVAKPSLADQIQTASNKAVSYSSTNKQKETER